MNKVLNLYCDKKSVFYAKYYMWSVSIMRSSYEANKCCDIEGVIYIPSDLPDIEDIILDLKSLPPTKLFDDLYFVGTPFVGTIVLKTEEGLVLIDTMNTKKDGEDIIFPGLKELGLDPKDIKKIILTHGHIDHYGAAKFIKEQTGCEVYMTEIDHKYMIDFIYPFNSKEIIQGTEADPGIDVYVNDGDIIKSGSYDIKVVYTPGHTPGGISLIFPVHDGGEEHFVGVWGGTKSPADISSAYDYVKSVDHFAKEAEKYGVDVSVQVHPFVDYNLDKGIFDGVEKKRDSEGRHPLVMGKERYKIFLDCIRAYAVGYMEKIKSEND